MESEYSSAGKGELDAGCEEVILPSTSVTNGAATEVSDGAAEYLEEHDPMAGHSVKTAKVGAEGAILPEGAEEYVETAEEDDEEVEGEGEEVDEDDADAEADEEAEVATERKPTQVPKKRKDAVILAATADGNAATAGQSKKASPGQVIKQEHALDLGDEDDDEADADDGEEPTSTARVAANKDNTVDEEQCRVCTTKEDLVSLFKKVEQLTVAEMLMTICPKVSIARKDFMPQFICNPCMDNVTIAMQLKAQCEKTEHELRKKLSRSKNKVRRPTGFVVIDGPVESDPATEEDEEQNDEEFKVSDETGLSMEDDSDDSDFESTKKKPTRGAGAKRGRRKSAAATPAPKKRMGRPPKRLADSALVMNSSDEGEEQPMPIKKKKKKQTQGSPGEQPQQEYPCDECEQVFTRKLSLVLHKKRHGGRKPINCEVCGKQFKIQGAYRTHLERHKDDSTRFECGKCESVFNTRADLRYHLADDHQEEGVVFQCDKCKRSFVTEGRLKTHQDGHCRGFETKQKKHDYENYAVGKDLFKTVAPLTTTYWSDSFSD